MKTERDSNPGRISRRTFLRASLIGTGAVALAAAAPRSDTATGAQATPPPPASIHGDDSGSVGDVDLLAFDPTTFLESFDAGRASPLGGGRSLREWDVVAINKDVEVAPGVFFPAWTFNGQVPGPTFRAREGDLLRFHFTNGSSHAHTIHFHSIHPPGMDGVDPIVEPGSRFEYEFEARPFGLHLYHCHVMPLKRHIHKGLYGAFIIDPPGGRAPAHEMVMVMNAFDTNFDSANEVYAVNTVAFHHVRHPIQVKVGELVRVYLVNITEFDPVNSFHLHASMFRLYRTGTDLDHYELTDVVTMGQGERHVLEFTLEHPGLFMFHAHQSEFAELGWLGMFEAREAAA
jgi:FtsP/CotA-like multicopper oxidase with cupredoxin domain